MKRIILVLITFVFLTLQGCSYTENKEKNEKTLVYGSCDYTNINPVLYEHGEINSLIFSGIVSRDKENNIIPCLAKDWKYDEESMTYIFYLRDDVKWHDGEKFTAEDVKFTLDTIMNPNNNSEIASNYEEIETVDILNENEVKIKLSAPNVALLDYLTVGIIPKHILEGEDIITSDFNKNPIGTGPYKVDKWEIGQSITLVKNNDYFKKKPNIDRIIFKIVEDTKVKAIQLKSGELDLAQVSPKDIENLKDNDNLSVYNMKTADYRGIMYNFNSPVFKNNKELPKALSYGIDREKIINTVLLGYGEKAYSPLQMSEFNNENIEKFEYNPNKAREELENSGWKMNKEGIYEKNGSELSFTVVCPEGDQVRIDMANICAQELREIGANVEVRINTKIDWKNQDAYLIGWGSPFDPDDHTYKVFGTNKGANFSSYSNLNIDNILKLARETNNKEERIDLYKSFQEEMTKDMPYTYIAYINAIYIGKSNIVGINENQVLSHHGVGIFDNVEEWDIK